MDYNLEGSVRYRTILSGRYTCGICERRFSAVSYDLQERKRLGQQIICVRCRERITIDSMMRTLDPEIEFRIEQCGFCKKEHMIMIETEQRETLKCNRCGFTMASVPENKEAVVGKIVWVTKL